MRGCRIPERCPEMWAAAVQKTRKQGGRTARRLACRLGASGVQTHCPCFWVCGAPGRLRATRGPPPPRSWTCSAASSPLRSKEILRHAPPSTSGMKNAPGKRPQTDTKSPTIPAAPAIDRSPAAKVQALRNDGSDLLTPHSSRRSQNCSMRRDPPTFSRATPRRPARQIRCLILCRAKSQASTRQ